MPKFCTRRSPGSPKKILDATLVFCVINNHYRKLKMNQLKPIKWALSFLILWPFLVEAGFARQEGAALHAQNSSKAEKRYVVGVARFQNKTGKKGLDFLGDSISEQVSTTLASDPQTTVVERGQLGSLLNEIELSQSGLMGDQKVMKELKLSGAEYLVVGTYTGSSSNMTVSIRLVEVETGRVLGGRTAQGPVDNILSKIDYESSALFDMVRGKKFGRVTITSQPPGATVFIDGRNAGVTPLSGFSVRAGNRNIRIYQEGYEDYNTTVNVQQNRVAEVSAELVRLAIKNMVGFYGGFDVPIYFNQYARPNASFKIGIYYMFRFIRVGVDFSYSLPMNQNYTYIVPYNQAELVRDVTVSSLFFTVVGRPFIDSPYFSPYAGATVGVLWHSYKVPDTLMDVYGGESQYYATGPVVGVSIFPYSRVRFFLETRYLWALSPVYDTRIKQVDLSGKITQEINKITLDFLSIGAGISVQF